jgi:hypothetical protein
MAKGKAPNFIKPKDTGLSTRAVDTSPVVDDPGSYRWLDVIERYDEAKTRQEKEAAKKDLLKLLRNEQGGKEARFLLADLLERELKPKKGRAVVYRPSEIISQLWEAEASWRSIKAEQKAARKKEKKDLTAREKRILKITQDEFALTRDLDPNHFNNHLTGKLRYSREFKKRLPRP